MGYKVNKIYVWNNQVRPAIAPSNLIIFPDTTTSALTDAWRTVNWGIYIDSTNWLYNTGSGRQWISLPITYDASNVVTLRAVFMTGNVWSWTWTVFMGLVPNAFTYWNNGADAVYYGLMVSQNYNFGWCDFNHYTVSLTVPWAANTWYEGTLTIDLPNATMSTVVTEYWSSTPIATFPDRTISNVANTVSQLWSIWIATEKNYVYVKEFERSIS